MKRLFLVALAVVAVAVALGAVFRTQLFAVASGLITADMYVDADTDTFDPGLPVGARFPEIKALSLGKQMNDVRPFSRDKGLIVVANRSADWCPYCMAQFMQLQGYIEAFYAADIGVVALTYDAPELQQAFVDKNGIEYPFLSDVDAFSVKALGILNTDYAPGDSAYGIPHPGIFIVDPDGVIKGKIFVDAYSQRVTAESVLATAKSLLQ